MPLKLLLAFIVVTLPLKALAYDGPMVLALTWQPAFCEKRSNLPECVGQKRGRFDTTNLSLHGLWPGPRGVEYCGVDTETIRLDKRRQWKRLPGLGLPSDIQRQLFDRMPGVRSGLHRHEWVKHGTCYGADAVTYFDDSLAALNAVNRGAVGRLMRRSLGRYVTARAIRDAVEEDFGRGAGTKVRLKCTRDGKRNLVQELRFNLGGPLDNFADALARGRSTGRGCDGGVVDRAGLQ
ncbi:MAG: ribonuclease T [Pseudomonadota bacterium]